MKHVLLFLTLLFLFAEGTSPAAAFKTEAIITAVSAKSISVRIGHANHSYHITKKTEIRVDGRKANATELKKGMRAEVTADLLDPRVAMTIVASGG